MHPHMGDPVFSAKDVPQKLKPEASKRFGLSCESAGIRTRDHRLKRAVLYLLSYALMSRTLAVCKAESGPVCLLQHYRLFPRGTDRCDGHGHAGESLDIPQILLCFAREV